MKKRRSLSLYWKCQLIGWSAASLYWGLTGFLGGHFNFFIGLLQFISDVILYILITHLYRLYSLYRRWQLLALRPLLKRIIPADFIMAAVYLSTTLVKVYLFNQWLMHGHAGPWVDFFKANGLLSYMAGFRLMSIWLLAYHLYYYGKREAGLVKENVRLALMAKEAQLNALSAKLNPHFLFNSLNTIKALVIEDPQPARRAIDLLSDLLRASLYNDGLLLCAIKEELGLVRDYLELEQLRLEERLQFGIECPRDMESLSILRHSVLVLVENAVKHGIGRQKSGGLTQIRIDRQEGFIRMMVQNPGKLSTQPASQGLGLKNLRDRLWLQYKGKAGFTIQENEGVVSALIKIPAP